MSKITETAARSMAAKRGWCTRRGMHNFPEKWSHRFWGEVTLHHRRCSCCGLVMYKEPADVVARVMFKKSLTAQLRENYNLKHLPLLRLQTIALLAKI